jgi:hypothetical protein
MILGRGMELGWRVSLQCERRRAGLKSVRACAGVQQLDMATLVASHGHMIEMADLQGLVVCPRCGSKNVALSFHAPTGGQTAEVGEPGRRQMRVARSGEVTLGTCPQPWIVVICDRCKRRGEYKHETLLAKYGPDFSMPSLHHHVAADAGCALARGAIDTPDNSRAFPCAIKYDVDTSDLSR